MFSIFRPILDRLKVIFATSAAQELESEFMARDAERRAELLRQATRYEQEGLHGIALQLRQRVDELDGKQPLAGVLSAISHLQLDLADTNEQPRLENSQPTPALPEPKKKGKK